MAAVEGRVAIMRASLLVVLDVLFCSMITFDIVVFRQSPLAFGVLILVALNMEITIAECWRLVCIVMDCHINVSVICSGVVQSYLLSLLKITEVSDYTGIVAVAIDRSWRKKYIIARDIIV